VGFDYRLCVGSIPDWFVALSFLLIIKEKRET
jgi:hypothetical protein